MNYIHTLIYTTMEKTYEGYRYSCVNWILSSSIKWQSQNLTAWKGNDCVVKGYCIRASW